jgi:hydroxyacylglutathione hydrolase
VEDVEPVVTPLMTEYGQQVLPHLYVVSWLGMTQGNIDSHVYVLTGRDGLLLVDCGTPWGHARIRRNMAHWGLRVEDVRTILLTHGHVDHVSGGYLFKDHAAEVLGHREIQTLVECQWEATGGIVDARSGYRVDGYLNDGDVIQRCGWEVKIIHTPGHTRGCVSFLITVDGARCLFTGDLIMSNCRPGWHGDPGFSAVDLVASLRRLLAVPFDHLCAGHDVRLNDRGDLFRRSLACYEAGGWADLGEVRGRKRAE